MDKPAAVPESTERDALRKLANEVRGWLDLEPVRLAGILGNTNVAVMREKLALADSITVTPASPVAGVSADRKSIAKLIDACRTCVDICEDGDTGADFGRVVSAMNKAREALNLLPASPVAPPDEGGYKCYHCKNVFPEVTDHFGKYEELPKCLEYMRGGVHGGIHDAYIRVRKDVFAAMEKLPPPVAGTADRKDIAKLLAAEMWPDSSIEQELASEMWGDPTGDSTFVAAAFKIIGKLLAQPSAEGDGWIAVSERLPDEFAQVLVVWASGDIDISMRNGDGWGAPIIGKPAQKSYTHWRPLPAPPVAKEGRES